MNNHFVLLEHCSLFISDTTNTFTHPDGHVGIPERSFNEIYSFVVKNESNGIQFLKPSYHRSLGNTLKAQQFVGVIETTNGTVIEILPKIHSDNLEQTRKALLNMLKLNKSLPFRNINLSSLQCEKLPLLEIFIVMFCEELSQLVKSGLLSGYQNKEENTRFIKGRILISQNIRKNFLHKETLYTSFDEFETNRIENRLIRTTIEYLLQKKVSTNIKQRLREFLFVFNDIEPIKEIDIAFKKLVIDRQALKYHHILNWCRIFLQRESFSSFKGDSIAYSLLFDMNKIFEGYVYYCLKMQLHGKNVRAQKTEYYLLERPEAFKLKPDLLIDPNIVADTKWKTLYSDKSNYGISQADIYQMFAYGKKYPGINEIWLIYPLTEETAHAIGSEYYFEDNLKLTICGFDCLKNRLLMKQDQLLTIPSEKRFIGKFF